MMCVCCVVEMVCAAFAVYRRYFVCACVSLSLTIYNNNNIIIIRMFVKHHEFELRAAVCVLVL